MMNVAPGQEEVPFCALSLLTMTSLRNPWVELHHPSELHIDHHYRILLRSERASQAIDPEEIEANAFAAELLMPQAMLEKDVKEQVIDYEDDEMIRTLAHRYKVSLQAMIFRLTNLGFIAL